MRFIGKLSLLRNMKLKDTIFELRLEYTSGRTVQTGRLPFRAISTGRRSATADVAIISSLGKTPIQTTEFVSRDSAEFRRPCILYFPLSNDSSISPRAYEYCTAGTWSQPRAYATGHNVLQLRDANNPRHLVTSPPSVPTLRSCTSSGREHPFTAYPYRLWALEKELTNKCT